MDPKERERKLDEWLDDALSHYNDAEPRLGLERRVLARLKEEEKPAKRTVAWWRWMPAFAAVAAVVIVAVAVRPVLEKRAEQKQQVATYSTAPSAAPAEKKIEESKNATAETATVQPPSLKPNQASRVARQSTIAPAEPVARANKMAESPVAGNDNSAPSLAAKVGHTEETVEVQSEAAVVGGVVSGTAAAPAIAAAQAPPPARRKAVAPTTMVAMAPQMRATADLVQGQTPTQSFPSAAPLTREERELLQYSAKLAQPSQRVERSNALTEIPKLEIRNIEIAPLEGPQK